MALLKTSGQQVSGGLPPSARSSFQAKPIQDSSLQQLGLIARETASFLDQRRVATEANQAQIKNAEVNTNRKYFEISTQRRFNAAMNQAQTDPALQDPDTLEKFYNDLKFELAGTSVTSQKHNEEQLDLIYQQQELANDVRFNTVINQKRVNAMDIKTNEMFETYVEAGDMEGATNVANEAVANGVWSTKKADTILSDVEYRTNLSTEKNKALTDTDYIGYSNAGLENADVSAIKASQTQVVAKKKQVRDKTASESYRKYLTLPEGDLNIEDVKRDPTLNGPEYTSLFNALNSKFNRDQKTLLEKKKKVDPLKELRMIADIQLAIAKYDPSTELFGESDAELRIKIDQIESTSARKEAIRLLDEKKKFGENQVSMFSDPFAGEALRTVESMSSLEEFDTSSGLEVNADRLETLNTDQLRHFKANLLVQTNRWFMDPKNRSDKGIETWENRILTPALEEQALIQFQTRFNERSEARLQQKQSILNKIK